MPQRYVNFILALFVILLSSIAQAQLKPAADVINPGTTAWIAAAKSSRADMLLIGDSTIWHMGEGWDAGIILALSKRIGLAGTGLLQAGAEGEGYSSDTPFQTKFLRGVDAIRADRRGYAWRADAITANNTPPGGDFVATILNTTLSAAP